MNENNLLNRITDAILDNIFNTKKVNAIVIKEILKREIEKEDIIIETDWYRFEGNIKVTDTEDIIIQSDALEKYLEEYSME